MKLLVEKFPGSGWVYRCKECGSWLEPFGVDKSLNRHPTHRNWSPLPRSFAPMINCSAAGQVFGHIPNEEIKLISCDERPTVEQLEATLASEEKLKIETQSDGSIKAVPEQVNPWKKETFNVTSQQRLIEEDSDEAIRLAIEAGKEIPQILKRSINLKIIPLKTTLIIWALGMTILTGFFTLAIHIGKIKANRETLRRAVELLSNTDPSLNYFDPSDVISFVGQAATPRWNKRNGALELYNGKDWILVNSNANGRTHVDSQSFKIGALIGTQLDRQKPGETNAETIANRAWDYVMRQATNDAIRPEQQPTNGAPRGPVAGLLTNPK